MEADPASNLNPTNEPQGNALSSDQSQSEIIVVNDDLPSTSANTESIESTQRYCFR
jgi:hypothetical protein